MSVTRSYFDWAATAPIHEKASAAAMETAKTYFANPSSPHSEGASASAHLLRLRSTAASLLNTKPQHIIFTSGGTESNAIIMSSLLWSKNPGEIIISAIEHPALSRFEGILAHLGWKVISVPAPNGVVSPQSIGSLLTEKTRMVCIMAVNNITGTIQPIAEIAKIISSFSKTQNRSIHFHCDAVQALGKIPIDANLLGCDSIALSGHKIGAMKGVGILVLNQSTFQSLSRGGGQERGIRPGTENLPGIASMVAMMEEIIPSFKEEVTRLEHLKRSIIDKISVCKGITVLSPLESAAHILSLSVAPVPSEVFSRMLNDKGFAVSSGSACSHNAKTKDDSILLAMGYTPKQAASAIRISLGWSTTAEQCNALADTIITLYQEATASWKRNSI